MHSAFEIAKCQRHLPDGHQRLAKPKGSAQAPRSPFSVLSPLRSVTPNAKLWEWHKQRNLFWVELHQKQAKTSRLKALSHYSSWPSSFEVCLNPDWHVHAGRTITAASALQMSSDHVGRNLSGKVCFILRGCPANNQVMSFVVICYHPHPPTTYPAICYAATWLSERKRSFLATWAMDLHEPLTGLKKSSTGKQSKKRTTWIIIANYKWKNLINKKINVDSEINKSKRGDKHRLVDVNSLNFTIKTEWAQGHLAVKRMAQ